MTHCWSVVLVSFIIQMYCLKGWGYLHLNVLSKIHLDHSHLNLTVGKGKKKKSQGLFQPVCVTGELKWWKQSLLGMWSPLFSSHPSPLKKQIPPSTQVIKTWPATGLFGTGPFPNCRQSLSLFFSALTAFLDSTISWNTTNCICRFPSSFSNVT